MMKDLPATALFIAAATFLGTVRQTLTCDSALPVLGQRPLA